MTRRKWIIIVAMWTGFALGVAAWEVNNHYANRTYTQAQETEAKTAQMAARASAMGKVNAQWQSLAKEAKAAADGQ